MSSALARKKITPPPQPVAPIQKKPTRQVSLGDPRRMRMPLLVEGILDGPSPTVTLEPQDFHKVNVDQLTYQRWETSLVNEIILSLKNGGRIYQPIAIATRPDGTWWLVDGLQRFTAVVHCNVPVPTIYYKSTGPKSEAMLFIHLNKRRNLTADTIIKGHQGPGAKLIREAADDPGHPIYNVVHFGGRGRPRRSVSACIVMRGLLAVATGTVATGNVYTLCSRLDFALQNEPAASQRCGAFLRLMPRVFASEHAVKVIPLVALGRVGFDHWRLKIRGPSERSCAAISRIPWETFYKSSSVAWLPPVQHAIEKRWRDS